MKLIAVLGLVSLGTLIPQYAAAFPVAGSYVDQGGVSNCDNTHGSMLLTEELGPAGAGFPVDEQIVVSIAPTAQEVACAFSNPLPDFVVTMTNTSPNAYTNLFFVLAAGFATPQFPRDGQIDDLNDESAFQSFAFQIDAVGANQPLLSESGAADGVFASNETWVFLVTNPGFSQLLIGSTGIVLGDNAIDSNASIVGQPIPALGGRLLPSAALALLLIVARKAWWCG